MDFASYLLANPNILYLTKVIRTHKVIQGHRVWYQSKAHMRLPISD